MMMMTSHICSAVYSMCVSVCFLMACLLLVSQIPTVKMPFSAEPSKEARYAVERCRSRSYVYILNVYINIS